MGRRIAGLIAFSTAAVLSGCSSKSSSSSTVDAGSDGSADAGRRRVQRSRLGG